MACTSHSHTPLRKGLLLVSGILLAIVGTMIAFSVSPHPALATDASPEATGTPYAVLQDDGELVLFLSDETYEAGENQDVTDIQGNQYHGKVYLNYTDGSSSTTWTQSPDNARVKPTRH